MEYTPSQVWSILLDGSEDLDELIDVQVGLARLPLPQRTFLLLISYGYPASFAMRQSGLRGNQTRLKREVLRQITDLINGLTD